MSALSRKLWRDLWNLKGQAMAIVLVMISGAATLVMSLSVLDSLKLTQATFYDDYRFADVFASLKRAPESVRSRIQSIPGIHHVETRVIAPVNLDIEYFDDPVSGLLVSVPDSGESLLNALYLKQGRIVEPGSDDEVVISEAFAEAHGFRPGDRLRVTVNGRRRTLNIVGIALSPEFIYQIRPGDFIPDFESYGILWMARKPLAAAYDMEGAFNDVTLSLSSEAQLKAILPPLDKILKRYGGLGAYGRKDQVSHRYLSEEFRQLEQMATIFPTIFLSVAAFLLNVVVSRLVRAQREQIATLKAFGYGNFRILAHYMKLVALISVFGASGGIALGVWLGKGLGEMYLEFYRFPFLLFELRPSVAATAALVIVAAALVGTLYSVWEAAKSPPAEAMRPEPPAKYRETLIERLGLKRWFSQPARMIARNIERRPLKSFLASLGIALAFSILMMGTFFSDAIDYMVKVQFGLAQRDDLSVTLVEPTSRKALYELQNLRGVEYVEVFRAVPVKLKFEHRSYRTAIQAVEPGPDLFRLLDSDLMPIEVPPSGIVLTDYLAKILGVRPGDRLRVEVLEGSRPVVEVPVQALVRQYLGVSGYMRLDALNRLLGEGSAISGLYVAADSRYQNEIYRKLKGMPRVASTTVRKNALRNFYDTMAEQILTFAFFNTLLAGTIAFGVVYNSARIALSERSRELASLRVLGFTRGEISFILLGELGVLTLIALPLGAVIGRTLCAHMTQSMQNDLFRIPLVVEPSTYAFSGTVVLASAVISSLVVRRRLDHLDLVAVLKTKE